MVQPVFYSGNFISKGISEDIPLRGDVDYMSVRNNTQIAATQTPGRGISFEWDIGMADNTAIIETKLDAVNTTTKQFQTGGGFLLIKQDESGLLEAAPANAITAITAANPPLVSQTAHGLVTGDVARLFNTTAMLQAAGIDYHITRVDANSYQLTYLDASGFVAPATGGTSRRYRYENPFTPRKKYISTISQATQAVIEFTTLHDYVVGERAGFRVPVAFGMLEMNNLVGEVVAIATNTITVDINSTAFTAFAYPASGAIPFTQAHTVAVGEKNTLHGAVQDTAKLIMRLAAGVNGPAGSVGDVMRWTAWK